MLEFELEKLKNLKGSYEVVKYTRNLRTLISWLSPEVKGFLYITEIGNLKIIHIWYKYKRYYIAFDYTKNLVLRRAVVGNNGYMDIGDGEFDKIAEFDSKIYKLLNKAEFIFNHEIKLVEYDVGDKVYYNGKKCKVKDFSILHGHQILFLIDSNGLSVGSVHARLVKPVLKATKSGREEFGKRMIGRVAFKV